MTGADFDNQFEEQFRFAVKDFHRAGLQPKTVEDLHGSEDLQILLSRYLNSEASERRAIHYRLQAIESAIKGRRSGGFAHYLIAMGLGVAATLAWQTYGEATKQIIATKAPELGWPPETKQMITGWMQQLGWAKQLASPESTGVVSAGYAAADTRASFRLRAQARGRNAAIVTGTNSTALTIGTEGWFMAVAKPLIAVSFRASEKDERVGTIVDDRPTKGSHLPHGV